jgi:hypothetical protein
MRACYNGLHTSKRSAPGCLAPHKITDITSQSERVSNPLDAYSWIWYSLLHKADIPPHILHTPQPLTTPLTDLQHPLTAAVSGSAHLHSIVAPRLTTFEVCFPLFSPFPHLLLQGHVSRPRLPCYSLVLPHCSSPQLSKSKVPLPHP